MPKRILLAFVFALCCTGMAWADCSKCGSKDHEGGCDKHHHDKAAMHDADDDDHGMAQMGDHEAFKEGRLVSIYDCRVIDPRCCPGGCYELMEGFHPDCEPEEEELERCDCCPEECEKCEKKPCTCAEEEDDDDMDDECLCHCYMPYTPPGPRQPLVTVHLWDALYESDLEPIVEVEEIEEVVTVEGRG